MTDTKLPGFTSSRDGNDPEEKFETHTEYTWTGTEADKRNLKSIVVWNDFSPTHKIEYNAAGKTIRVLGTGAAPLNLHLHLANQLVRMAEQYK